MELIMLINLKTNTINAESQKVVVEITERLPANIEGPCVVNCDYNIEKCADYFILTLAINSKLTITCQRCLNEFQHDYSNQTVLAVCHSDERAVELMSNYECVVAKNNQVDLIELITDELYLYTPDNHQDISDCDKVVSEYISLKNTDE
jgi:uncharacterized protein